MKKICCLMIAFIAILTLSCSPLKASAATASSKAGAVAITSGSLNVRKTPSRSAAVVSSLKKNAYVTLISKSGEWWRVEYAANKYGYCHTDYIKTISGTAKKVSLTSGTLNVRKGAGTSYSRIDSLTNGKIVVELNRSGGWSRILFGGSKTGYVSSKYLKDTNTATSYPAIRLNVPSFKQYDSRWADVKIGSSGKTIGKIGCATTAIAMIESFKTGRTIYPDAMSKKLSYTSSGNVYWPSNYKAVTSKSGYLSRIYSELKVGKPVLLGAKNKYGSQHWVVITGYTGGDTLTESGFTINDPGSKTRTTLKAFLNDYPSFYKYFYFE